MQVGSGIMTDAATGIRYTSYQIEAHIELRAYLLQSPRRVRLELRDTSMGPEYAAGAQLTRGAFLKFAGAVMDGDECSQHTNGLTMTLGPHYLRFGRGARFIQADMRGSLKDDLHIFMSELLGWQFGPCSTLNTEQENGS